MSSYIQKGDASMNILHVIHGYPPHYMAGSEVYTWNLCKQLAGQHQVSVFTRIENPYAAPYEISDSIEDGVQVRRINKAMRDYTFKDKYLDPAVDDAFRATLRDFQPDTVHFGHLSHLSSQLPIIARQEFGIPVVFTIHDFWLHCFRGQLVRPDMSICDGPSPASCLACAQRFFKDGIDAQQIDAYQAHMRDVIEHVDIFLAPSRTVESFFIKNGVPRQKLRYSRYGFDISRITPVKSSQKKQTLRFGFLGRVIPVKGIHTLLRAFAAVEGDSTLQIWGDTETQLSWLKSLCKQDPRVQFMGRYHNGEIQQVLENIDVMVAPSLWLENAPLVIQESFLANVPVVTSDAGGMAELVEEGVTGFLFPLGDEQRLTQLLQQLADQPEMLKALRESRGSVRSIEDDAAACVAIYDELQTNKKEPVRLPMRPAPWRVTFVTNPGVCNLHCAMCDTHSKYAPARTKSLPQLDFPLVRQTITVLAQRGLREVIPSTMGEPLLYSHFSEMIELVQSTGLRLNLTTNGTFPNGGIDYWASVLLPVLSDIKFSINSVDPNVAKVLMGGINADKQLHNIQRYLELKTKYEQGGGQLSTASVQATFMESNLNELPHLLKWAIQHNMDRFKGHQLWVNWPELQQESLRRSEQSIERWNRMVSTLIRIADTEKRPNGKKIRLENIVALDREGAQIDLDDTICPFLGQEAWVEADGSFQVCCCPSELRRKFGDFGSLHEHSFMEIWRSPQYRKFVQDWGHHPNCLACNMRKPKERTQHV